MDKAYDPSRLVNSASGALLPYPEIWWTFTNYPDPEMYLLRCQRTNVLGDYVLPMRTSIGGPFYV